MKISELYTMPGVKGKTNNPKGRPVGIENRTTKEAKEFLQAILYAEFDNIQASLQRAREDNDTKYLDSLVKLLSFIMPKQTDITSGGEKLPNPTNIIVNSQDSKERLETALKTLQERDK